MDHRGVSIPQALVESVWPLIASWVRQSSLCTHTLTGSSRSCQFFGSRKHDASFQHSVSVPRGQLPTLGAPPLQEPRRCPPGRRTPPKDWSKVWGATVWSKVVSAAEWGVLVLEAMAAGGSKGSLLGQGPACARGRSSSSPDE